MYKNLVTRRALCVLAVASFLSPLSITQAQTSPPPLKVGFVYVAPLTDAGWVRQHEQGRLAVQAALGSRVETRYVENVPEGADAERVIRDLAQQGARIIFTPSFGYMEPTLKVAREFPDVKFESVTGYKTAPNVATANARYYEGRYLAGVAAGRMATQAGYVAGFPIPEVIQGINAFTLGMRSVSPRATYSSLVTTRPGGRCCAAPTNSTPAHRDWWKTFWTSAISALCTKAGSGSAAMRRWTSARWKRAPMACR